MASLPFSLSPPPPSSQLHLREAEGERKEQASSPAEPLPGWLLGEEGDGPEP